MRSLAPAALVVILLGAAAPLTGNAQQAPVPAAEPAPAAPSPAPSPAPPAAAPLPPPAAAPAVAPTPLPAPTPTDTFRYIVTPPAAAPGLPAILEIDLLDSTIHAGMPYSVRVKTSLDVTALNVSAMGSTYGMQMARPGLFASDGQVPSGIPFFMLAKTYTVTVTAIGPGGKSTTFPLSLRLDR